MVIGLDVGSTGVKALRLEGGRAAGMARRPIATRRDPGGRVEHDAREIVRAALAVLRAAAGTRGAGGAAGSPIDLGIATQRSTVLFWDRDTGRPLTPAYSWQDVRGAALCARLRRRAPEAEDQVAARTGLRLSPHYSAAKLAWALRNVRGLWRRIEAGRALWGPLASYLLFHLTRGAVYAVDHANAQRTLLFDLAGRAWDPALFDLFGLRSLLDAPALPALLTTCPAAPVPIDAGGRRFRLKALNGDQQAAAVGLGCGRRGEVAINYGSGAFVFVRAGEFPARVPGLLTTLLASWRDAGGRESARYAVEGTVNAAATAIEWAGRRLGVRVRTSGLDRFLGEDGGGPRRVHFLPALSGLGAPHWRPGERARFAGEVAAAGARERMRAVVESIAERCAEIVLRARRVGRAPVLAAGGLTRCRSLLQAQADLLQRPVIVSESPDATAVGAALLAARGARALEAKDGGRRPAGSGLAVLPAITGSEAAARRRAWARAVYGPAGTAPVPGRSLGGAAGLRRGRSALSKAAPG